MAATVPFNLSLKLLGLPQLQPDAKTATRSWQGINDNTKLFQRQGIQARDALRDLREGASHFGRTFSEVFQFGGIAGLLGGGGLIATLAGLGRQTATTGLEVSNMTARLGVGGKALQDWRKTAGSWRAIAPRMPPRPSPGSAAIFSRPAGASQPVSAPC